MIEIKDVKMKGNTDVKVSFIESDGGKVTEYVVSSNEAPRPEFIQAMCSLAPDLMGIIGISITDGEKADERPTSRAVPSSTLGMGILTL